MAEASPKTPKKAAPKASKTDAAGAKTETKKVVAKAAPKKAASVAASKAVTEKKPAAVKKPAPAKAAAPRKAVAKKAPANTGTVSNEQRYRMIAEAAYYRAESCQFKSDPLRDWIEAERDIAVLLRESV